MLDLLRKYMDSLTGITEMPRERAERLAQELQKRGEVRAKDLRKAAQQLVDRSRRNREELLRLVRKEIRRQVNALGLASREDLDKLAKRVKALESRGGSPSRGSSRKKSSAPKKTSSKKGSTSGRSTKSQPKS